jgi:prepilin-type N-terminal cleavage/methylation domain-containing protein
MLVHRPFPRSVPRLRTACRAGFSLIETLIAVAIVNVGLLALVGSSAALVRHTNELRTRAAALRIASNRIERLGAAPCGGASGSTIHAGGIREQWAVTVRGNRIREVRDSVTFTIGAAARATVLTTRLPC